MRQSSERQNYILKFLHGVDSNFHEELGQLFDLLFSLELGTLLLDEIGGVSCGDLLQQAVKTAVWARDIS